MKPCKRIAIIGGGYSGLATIKALKEEEGLEPVCFEKSSEIGGTWCYRESVNQGSASIMSTTIINHSKEMGAISNYPFPKNCPNYMRHDELHRQMMEMAKKFDLLRHITCNREVVEVKRASDYEENGRWVVTVKNTETGEIVSSLFDGVTIGIGQFGCPEIPSFPGMGEFQGKILHSHSLKTFESFVGQRVVVVGTGCSALDAAAEISNVANQVYLSVRTPSWIMPRLGRHGLPFDYVLHRRYITAFLTTLPTRWASKMCEYFYLDTTFNHKLYGIHPKYPLLCRDPIINDVIPSKLLSGSVQLRRNISKIEEHGVVFEGESETTKIDTIIMATGYKWNFPFLEDGILKTEKEGKILLYKNMYPPHLKHPTLAFIGFILPFGPGFPIGELQSRWATYLFSGKGSLPSKEVMIEDIEKTYQENVNRYSPSESQSIRVDSIPYMDDIASQFGAKPNLLKMAFTDPRLFLACTFGASVPYQYRLQGPHSWEGAREAILTAPQRVKFPLSREEVSERTPGRNFIFQAAITFFLILFLLSSSTSSVKYYLLLILLPYFFTIKNMSKRYFLILLLLPFFVTLQDFVISYLITIFVPLLMATLVHA